MQPPVELCRPCVSFAASAGPDTVAPENEEEEDDDQDSIVSSPRVVDKTYAHLIMFMVSIPSCVLFLRLQCLHAVHLSCSPLRILRDPLDLSSGFVLGWRRLSPKPRIIQRG